MQRNINTNIVIDYIYNHIQCHLMPLNKSGILEIKKRTLHGHMCMIENNDISTTLTDV